MTEIKLKHEIPSEKILGKLPDFEKRNYTSEKSPETTILIGPLEY